MAVAIPEKAIDFVLLLFILATPYKVAAQAFTTAIGTNKAGAQITG